MRRHIERDNVVFLAIITKFDGVVAIVAVHDEQSIGASSTGFSVLVKVLQPLETVFNGRPALLTDR